ncbi:MAG: SDR family NAD(P)-dependent oxidoreductase [Pantoea sp. Morm]|uniref:oxidoreductase n=1 Tax=Pantoea sp. Morm TaxID=2601250 RepID=UPI001D322907|nr:SDR family NAD(P)-dependent oxidoreductase [Pantoea sp. Morm]
MSTWTFNSIPVQTGRTVIVTGANTGIGFETARMFALRGAKVVLACRDLSKGEGARRRIIEERPSVVPSVEVLDLADLDSIAAFSERFTAAHDRIDLLINNAGVMLSPLARTRQGFELQLGTNHLGHAALTQRLLPLVLRTPHSRIVIVSSLAHHGGHIAFDDLNWNERPYNALKAYQQSKLANLIFALELQRRLAASGCGVRVTAAHPGWTKSELQRHLLPHQRFMAGVLNPLLQLRTPDGALNTMRAATDPDAPPGSYWGPGRFFEYKGPPARARISERAQNEEVARRLWAETEKLTGLEFSLFSGNSVS